MTKKGLTLLVNIKQVEPELLMSEEIIKLLLLRCIEAADMTPVKHTWQIAYFPAPIKKTLRGDYGLSAGIILVESHIYIHTWPEKNYARFELSSCKEFDKDKVLKVIKTFFGVDIEIESQAVPWEG